MKEVSKFESIMLRVILGVGLSVICWLLIDTFVTDISYICSLVLEFIFFTSDKIYNFTVRRALGSSRA
jgi:ABC-type polysaccharide/polyol phosphate export permease